MRSSDAAVAAPARDRLAAAALRLFARHGYDAISVERVRATAGVSNGSFFHAYPGKAELACDLLVQCVADYQRSVIEALGEGRGAADGIEAVIDAHLRWVDRHRDRARFMLDEARSAWFAMAAPRLAELNRGFVAAIDGWRAPLARRGALHDEPVEVLVASLIGPANLLCRRWLANGTPAAGSPLRVRDALVATAVRGLVPAAGRGRTR